MKQIYVFALCTDDCCSDETYEEGDILFVKSDLGNGIMGELVFDERWEDTYIETGCYRIISDEEAEERGANVAWFRRFYPEPKTLVKE